MSRFLNAGHACCCEGGVLIKAGLATYEVPAKSVQRVLAYGAHEDLFRRVRQTTLDSASGLKGCGTISMSKTRKSVTIRPPGERLYLINADALRDVMRGKIPIATVCEVIFQRPAAKRSIKVPSS